MDVPSGDWSRQMAEAQRMMRELRGRDFRKHLREAEAEKAEAQRCKSSPDSVFPLINSKCSFLSAVLAVF